MNRLLGTGAAAAALALTLVAGSPTSSAGDSQGTATWTVDAAHSQVGFSVRHFFTPVKGSFHDYEVSLEYDPAYPENASVEVTIDVGSVDTSHERRDNDLRSDSWFDVERYPTMTFRSTSVRPVSDTEFVAMGELTIKDATIEIELPITVLGVMDVPENRRERLGEQVASFQAATVIDRRDFGVGVGSWTETTVVGADVEIEITIEANRR